MKLSSINAEMVRSEGAEHVCHEVTKELGIRDFLVRHMGWDERDTDIAILQIIARAVAPGSELATSKYLQRESSLNEMFNFADDEITKDDLYESALRLFGCHEQMEDYLHDRVSTLFGLKDAVVIIDLTNSNFEGRMSSSKICKRGRNKQKRNDCKQVALALVVDRYGFIVRSVIYNGNVADVTTLREVMSGLSPALSTSLTAADGKHVVVMDSGFASAENIDWLKNNGFHYITVMRSSGAEYSLEGPTSTVYDQDGQPIHLTKAVMESPADNLVLVESHSKTLKERAMYDQAIKDTRLSSSK